MNAKTNQRRDVVLRRMLKTPPKPHKPMSKGPTKAEQEALLEEIKRNPDRLDELARGLGQDGDTDA